MTAPRPPIRTLLLVALASCTDAGTPIADVEPEPEPVPPELVVQYIQRLPAIDWVWASDDPTREGWPAEGQEVTWQAHLKSYGGQELTAGYRWLVDGTEAARGRTEIPAGGTATVDLDWSWTFERHVVALEVDSEREIAESNEQNNYLEIYTDALSVGLWVEEGFYAFYRRNISIAARNMSGFEDWAQAHIARLNSIFRDAVYPETPRGVLDRVRLDKIVVVPDGSLDPRGARPAPQDRSVDLQWGFPAAHTELLGSASAGFSPVFEFNGALLHELGHARYLIDVYWWDLFHDFRGQYVDIREDGEPVVGTELLPFQGTITGPGDDGWVLHWTPEQGLMNDEYAYVDRYSAVALNLIAGHRATYGNMNCPENCGAYLDDLPAENVLVLRDEDGALMAGATVRAYQHGFHTEGPPPTQITWDRWFDDEPDLELVADAAGRARLGRNPFGVELDWGRGPLPKLHLILRVEHEGRVGYEILELRVFNLAFWSGHTEVAEYELALAMHPRGQPASARATSPPALPR